MALRIGHQNTLALPIALRAKVQRVEMVLDLQSSEDRCGFVDVVDSPGGRAIVSGRKRGKCDFLSTSADPLADGGWYIF